MADINFVAAFEREPKKVSRGLHRAVQEIAKRADEKNPRRFKFVASTDGIDRYNTKIRQDGWVLENFKKNPVLLWAHRAGEPPVGSVVEIYQQSEGKVNQTVVEVEFPEPGVYPFADWLRGLVEKNILRAVSVGFDVLDYSVLKDEDARKEGFENGSGVVFNRQELIELSLVSVPGNADALKKETAELCTSRGYNLDEVINPVPTDLTDEQRWDLMFEAAREVLAVELTEAHAAENAKVIEKDNVVLKAVTVVTTTDDGSTTESAHAASMFAAEVRLTDAAKLDEAAQLMAEVREGLKGEMGNGPSASPLTLLCSLITKLGNDYEDVREEIKQLRALTEGLSTNQNKNSELVLKTFKETQEALVKIDERTAGLRRTRANGDAQRPSYLDDVLAANLEHLKSIEGLTSKVAGKKAGK